MNSTLVKEEEQLEELFDTFLYLNKKDPAMLKRIAFKKGNYKTPEINDLYNKIVEMHENPKYYKEVKAKTRGDLFEELTKQITIKTNLFDLFDNITSDTNEYDIVIKLSDVAKITLKDIIPDIFHQPIICECKNYQQPVNVTWIGKLYMLLSMSKIKVGIIFSYEGVTGDKDKSWGDAWGLIRKIFLKDGIAIIDISKIEIKRIIDGDNFCDIVEEKYLELKTMSSDIEESKKYHPSSKKVNELLEKIKQEANI
ncbi:hypothetical protein DVV81_08095 [Clostridium botulinum]|uniref:hypothetical protein n=1 Tax=Clostridium botulinum TaxID=1491 RepID=UPI0019689D2B|nr:hypothetical protein [Clostridium botulinum]MBN1071129.1 hypothetical protein [Clostridium botulinum]